MRSHWGWGDELKRPTPEKIAPRATPFFGDLTVAQAVPIEVAVLPKPRVEVPKSNPIMPKDLMATIFDVLGFDQSMQFPDTFGRPQYLLPDGATPIAELV